MKKVCVLLFILTVVRFVGASWYWPFGSDESGAKKEVRLSDLMEPASELIDNASDLSSEGKLTEAVESYRAALKELDRIEAENPEKVEKPEFATVRTKRAYVNAAIDSLLMRQARENAKAVAVSDTTELEAKLAAEKTKGEKASKRTSDVKAAVEEKKTAVVKTKPVQAEPERPLTTRERVVRAIAEGRYEAAENLIRSMLEEKPNGVAALNLRAACETAQGKFKEAERTLDQAIQSNPRNYFAYYNMAELILRTRPENKAAARRYYESGRALGGPEDVNLEEAVR